MNKPRLKPPFPPGRRGPAEYSDAKTPFLISAVILFVVLLSQVYGCRGSTGLQGLRKGRRYNFILVSVDTLRPDRLGCYGFSKVETPVIDRMARRGVRFDNCISQTPLTLPSHTTLLTGTYPFYHGVRDNGGFVAPQELKTLAEHFKDGKYDTAAIVGAYVLDSKWGLDQGFDFYYDRFDTNRKEGFSVADVQRNAGEVITQALDWLEKGSRNPFFLFLHLYDPHTPYEPPSPYREKYASDLYLGEIAYTDSQLARLWDYLEGKGLLETTILVFLSDHGESLGGHGEATHGFFAYQEGIRVPLIFVLPFAEFQNLARAGTVSLVDVMPTVLELAGIPADSKIQGKSLVPLLEGKGASKNSPAYSETFYPRFHYGWSDVRTIQDGRFKLILSPGPELFDLADDPGEERNLAADKTGTVRSLEEEIADLEKKFGRGGLQTDTRKVDEEALRKLASLGYVGSFVRSAEDGGRPLPSPKDKIGVFNRIQSAKELSLQGKLNEAYELMDRVIKEEPDIVDAYFVLGNICFRQKKYEDAVGWFTGALARKPDYDFVVLNMAIAFIEMGNPAKAEEALAGFVETYPADAVLYSTLGEINLKREHYDEAVKNLEECLRLNPQSALAHNHLARVYIIRGDAGRAETHLNLARGLNPRLHNLHYNEAQLLEMKGLTAEAEKEYLAELEDFPDNANASFQLGLLYLNDKKGSDAEKYFRIAVDANPAFPFSYVFLARIYDARQESAEKILPLLDKAVSLGLDNKHLRYAYMLYGKTYLRIGRQDLAAQYARKIQALK